METRSRNSCFRLIKQKINGVTEVKDHFWFPSSLRHGHIAVLLTSARLTSEPKAKTNEIKIQNGIRLSRSRAGVPRHRYNTFRPPLLRVSPGANAEAAGTVLMCYNRAGHGPAATTANFGPKTNSTYFIHTYRAWIISSCDITVASACQLVVVNLINCLFIYSSSF